MKTRIGVLLSVVLVGCVPSWNPFYTEKDLVFDPALVGTWTPIDASESSKETWAFTLASDKLYQLKQTDTGGRTAVFDVRLFLLKGQRYVDLYPTKVEGDRGEMNTWAGFSLVPAHLLMKLEQVEPSLKLAATNPDWMQRYLKRNPTAIAHQVVGDGNIVLTACTADLQKFILAHRNDEDFFGGALELKRR